MEKKRTYGVWAVRSSTSIFGPAQSWCKENGKPLEFDTKAAAENYAKEANEHTTANVRYYVKEKEPEPGAVRKGTSQPELDARSHEEVIPRNDAAEKQNEIPGRQIPSQTDPLVEIRSAVHSNYAGMPLLSAPMWISTMSIITSLSTLLHWTVRKNFATSGVLPGQSGK